MYYAHTKNDPVTGKVLPPNQWQPLSEHLHNVEKLSGEFAGKINATEYGKIIGILHDVGKYSADFQKRLNGDSISVNHAYAGALEAISRYGKAYGKIFAYAIAGHHAGLPDGEELLKINAAELCDYSAYSGEITPPGICNKASPVVPTSKRLEDIGFCVSFLARYLYSCLVDADFLDTERFMQPDRFNLRGGYASIELLKNYFDGYISQRFSNASKTQLNLERQKVMTDCLQAAENRHGLFSLTVPTGGGKTFSSLAFALKHAVENKMDRIIYAIPYTSIIEQTARQFKEALGESNVLEHHSSFSPPDDEKAALSQRIASENWDAPVIVTTNVQFFESLFSNRSSRARKLHNIANSVIILDEAQMLPKDFMLPCLAVLKELIANYGCTVVFCTATQPAVAEYIGMPPAEIVSDPGALYEKLRRARIEFAGQMTDDALAAELKSHEQVLCIVNTRGQAAKLSRMIAGTECVYHLSTMMYPKHRARILKKIRTALERGEPCRVVSTQLVECGVDVDFPVVYRKMAGLDSIAQAAGRCNREGKLPFGMVFVFESEKVLKGEFSRAADAARSTLRRFDDMLSRQALTDYFKQFYSIGASNNLDRYEILRDIADGAMQQYFPFKKIAGNFRLIDSASMIPVIIPCDESLPLIELLKYMENPRHLSRKLQQYTVNVYENQFRALKRADLITSYENDMYYVLNNTGWYSETTGLLDPDDAPEYNMLMF